MRRHWRSIVFLVSIWLVILGYMGWQLMSALEESNRHLFAAQRKERHVEILQTQNDRLKKLIADLQSEKAVLQMSAKENEKKFNERLQRVSGGKLPANLKTPKTPAGFTTNLEYERLKRRSEKELQEMWYYISAEVTKINKETNANLKERLTTMVNNFEGMHHALTNNIDKLDSLTGRKEFMAKEHQDLTNLVQKRLHHLQNPNDCNSAKKLICQLNKGCGYGCQTHHLMYCFIVAYGLQRTLIIDSGGWRYSSKGWTGIFKPASETCTSHNGNVVSWSGPNEEQNILLPIVDSLYPRPQYMPLAVPEDLVERIQSFHGHPFVWWIGQFAKYLFRYSDEVEKEIAEKKEKLGFQKPIVGIQVRRTDKISTEAAYHSIEEYMYWVELYYRRLEMVQKVDKKLVYIATDDSSVLPEAKEKYPDYVFLNDEAIAKSAGVASRYSESSLHGVVFDIHMLSECDYLVCTFSSQVCRLGYEMMQFRRPNAAASFQSLDDVYYFGGQSGHLVRAVYPHKAKEDGHVGMEVGDLMGIAGNHWDGYTKGRNERTGQEGVYPSYKVEDRIDVVKFPSYPEH